MTGLDISSKKELAMQIVSTNENSSLDWRAQYTYIEDIGDGRGYTAGSVPAMATCWNSSNTIGRSSLATFLSSISGLSRL